MSSIAVTATRQRNGQYDALASVTLIDANGNKVVGATVAGTWSGAVNGNASGLTGSTGVANVKSNRVRSTGTFRFTVNSVTLSGYTYDASQNVETSDFTVK